MTLPVSESFVKEAHAAACADWKKRIEQEFPQVFDVLSKIKCLPEYKALKQHGATSTDVRLLGRDCLQIDLPNNNREWTFAAWDLAKTICQMFPGAFPRHVGEPDKLLIEGVR